jgi:hypothetical protein
MYSYTLLCLYDTHDAMYLVLRAMYNYKVYNNTAWCLYVLCVQHCRKDHLMLGPTHSTQVRLLYIHPRKYKRKNTPFLIRRRRNNKTNDKPQYILYMVVGTFHFDNTVYIYKVYYTSSNNVTRLPCTPFLCISYLSLLIHYK